MDRGHFGRAWGSVDTVMTALCIAVVVTTTAFEAYARTHSLTGPYWVFMAPDATVQYGLLCLGIFHAWVAKAVREAMAIGTASAIFALLILLGDFEFVRSDKQLFSYAVALGSAVVQIGVLAVLIHNGAPLDDRLRLARESVTFAMAVALPTTFVYLTMDINPTQDHLVAQFDDGLGIRIISLIKWVVSLSPFFREFLNWVYGGTPLAIAVIFAMQRPELPPVPLTVFISTVAGLALYTVIPVVGPPATYPEYYASLWQDAGANSLTPPTARTDLPRNCMPSLHTAWAVLFVFGSHGLPRLYRALSSAAAALTIVSAIEIGAHWFLDLVVALPFAVAVQGFASFEQRSSGPERMMAILGGSAIMLALLALMYLQPLRFQYSAVLHWAAVVAAVVASVYLWRRLADRALGGAQPRTASSAG